MTVVQVSNWRGRLWLLNFPRGYSEILRAPVPDERRQIVALAERLSAVDDPEIGARVEDLRAAAARTGRAYEAVQTALAEERTAYGLLQAEKLNWSQARRRLYHAIQVVYADDRRKAEYFFDHAPVNRRRNGKPADNGHGNADADADAGEAQDRGQAVVAGAAGFAGSVSATGTTG